MLNNRQLRMLRLLDKQILNCNNCTLCKNGRAKPYYNKNSKYAIVGEAPGYHEIKGGEPFVGQAGEILVNQLHGNGFKKEDFLIINSVNCRAVKSGTNANGKPTRNQLHACQPWIRKYLKVVNPEKILCLGNYAKYYFTESYEGVMSQRGVFRQYQLDPSTRSYPVLITVHPAFILYNEELGLPALQEDLKLFKEFKNTPDENWGFTEDEFNV